MSTTLLSGFAGRKLDLRKSFKIIAKMCLFLTAAVTTNANAEEISSKEKIAYLEAIFKDIPDNEPVYMLNMIHFNELAQYPAGHEFEKRGLTGIEAYEEYGRHVGLLLNGLNVTVIGGWEMGAMVAGPADVIWDSIFVVRYESARDFIGMVTSEEYAKIESHRAAAVDTAWLVRMSDGKRLVDSDSAEQ